MTENTILSTLQILRPKQLLRSDLVQKMLAALGSRGIVVILGFMTSIFIARNLGPEGRGLLGIASAITALGVQLGLLGFHSANTFHVSKNPSLLPTMISNSLLISSFIGALMILFLFFFRHLILGKDSLPLPLLLISLAIIPPNICFLLFQGLLTGVQKFKDYNLSDIINKAINTLLILIYILTGSLSPLNATCFQGVALILCLGIMLKTLSKTSNGLKAPSFTLIKESFFYGGKAYLACFFAWGITRSDIFLLQRFHSLEEVGYFSVALSLIDILLMLSSVISAILHPKLCRESNLNKKWSMTKKTTLGSSAVILFAALIIYLWSAPIRWMFGARFALCHNALVYLIPGFILLSIQTILVQFIISIRFPWSLVLIWGGAFGLKLLISLILIDTMGIKGVGIAWTITYLAIFIGVAINIKFMRRKKEFSKGTEAKIW